MKNDFRNFPVCCDVFPNDISCPAVMNSTLWTTLSAPELISFYTKLPFIILTLIFLVPFIGPIVLTLMIYSFSTLLVIESYRRALSKHRKKYDDNTGRNKISFLLYWISFLWHGYEIVGKENLPKTSALFIFYQGTLPIDILYFTAHLWKVNRRSCFVYTHKKHYRTSGLKRFNKRMNFIPMTRKQCVDNLLEGNDIILTFGADCDVNEGEKYALNWNKKKSFATIAAAAKIPIVPVFTKNIEEAFWIPWFLKKFTRGKRYPVTAGGLPVKLTTYIEEPIYYTETSTAQGLTAKTAIKIKNLITKHQRIPGNRFYALTDRLWSTKVKDDEIFEQKCTANGFPPIQKPETVAIDCPEEDFSEFVNQELEDTVFKIDFVKNGYLKTHHLIEKIETTGVHYKNNKFTKLFESQYVSVPTHPTDLEDLENEDKEITSC